MTQPDVVSLRDLKLAWGQTYDHITALLRTEGADFWLYLERAPVLWRSGERRVKVKVENDDGQPTCVVFAVQDQDSLFDESFTGLVEYANLDGVLQFGQLGVAHRVNAIADESGRRRLGCVLRSPLQSLPLQGVEMRPQDFLPQTRRLDESRVMVLRDLANRIAARDRHEPVPGRSDSGGGRAESEAVAGGRQVQNLQKLVTALAYLLARKHPNHYAGPKNRPNASTIAKDLAGALPGDWTATGLSRTTLSRHLAEGEELLKTCLAAIEDP